MHGQDLTKGNILSQLWSLAWPMMLSMLFFSLYNLVDAFWVGKLSPDAIAAVSISQISLFAMISLSMGISVGSSVLVGMNIGAGKKTEAEKILGQGFVLMAVSALAFSAIALVFSAPILKLSGAPLLQYFRGRIHPDVFDDAGFHHLQRPGRQFHVDQDFRFLDPVERRSRSHFHFRLERLSGARNRRRRLCDPIIAGRLPRDRLENPDGADNDGAVKV
jgi:hypothetical protein